MRTRPAALILTLGLFSGVGCGGGSKGTPTGASSSATSVTVSVTSPILMTRSAQATATATLAGGQSQTVTTGFRSDTPAVASVTDGGLVTGVANGLANVFVVFQGAQGVQQVRVVPNYGGRWHGKYVVRSCSHSGLIAEANFCGEFAVNTQLETAMSLTQTGESINGEFVLGEVEFPSFHTTVAGDGAIAFSSSMSDSGVTVAVDWQLNSPQNGRMTGRHTQNWTIAGGGGQGQVTTEIVDALTRVSTSSMAVRRVRPRAGLAEWISAVRGR